MFGAIAPDGSWRLRTETTAWVVRLGSLFSAVGIEAGGLKTWLSMIALSLLVVKMKLIVSPVFKIFRFKMGKRIVFGYLQ
jgi:hypothetical protein